MSAQRVLSGTEKITIKASFPVGSFVKWNKMGDQIWVVITAMLGNHLIRSLPNSENTYETRTADYANLILVKSAHNSK